MRNRVERWVAAFVVTAGTLLAGLGGLWIYMAATPPLHPDAQGVPSVTRATPSSEWTDAVSRARDVVVADVVAHSWPGVSVAVGVGDDVVWAEGFGWADLETRVPVAPETLFRIGTASTVFTSAAAGLLIEQGRLRLDDSIRQYIPTIPDRQWPVTIRQLMAHTAGVADDGGDEGPLLAQRCARPVDALRHLSGYEVELRFEPGTAFGYSSYGWILISAAIEAASQQPFLLFMQQHLFEPLGLRDTRAESPGEAIPGRATSYFPRFAADPRYGLHPMRPLDFSCYAGASGFLSTPSDLVRFGMAINRGALLKPETVRLLHAPQRVASGEDTGYGLGWDLGTATLGGEEATWVGHDGTVLGGMAASLITFPSRNLAVAVASNIPYAEAHDLAVKVAEAFADRTTPAAGEQ